MPDKLKALIFGLVGFLVVSYVIAIVFDIFDIPPLFEYFLYGPILVACLFFAGKYSGKSNNRRSNINNQTKKVQANKSFYTSSMGKGFYIFLSILFSFLAMLAFLGTMFENIDTTGPSSQGLIIGGGLTILFAALTFLLLLKAINLSKNK